MQCTISMLSPLASMRPPYTNAVRAFDTVIMRMPPLRLAMIVILIIIHPSQCSHTYQLDDRLPCTMMHMPRITRTCTGRYLAVYTYGGVYMDSDVEPMQPLSAVMDSCPTALFWEPRVYRGGARWGENARKGLLNIAVLMAKDPGSPVLGEVLLRVVDKLNAMPASATKRPNPVYSTGPNPAAKAVYHLKDGRSQYSSTLRFASAAYFRPILNGTIAAKEAAQHAQEMVPGGDGGDGGGGLTPRSSSEIDAGAAPGVLSVSSTLAEDPTPGVAKGGTSDGGKSAVQSESESELVCEVDHPDSDLLFEHRFFCTYCDRGPKHNRADRETLRSMPLCTVKPCERKGVWGVRRGL